ncbi:MAG: hypothetical protein ACE5MG_08730 [Candidatus Methylomirabilales bacterium]
MTFTRSLRCAAVGVTLLAVPLGIKLGWGLVLPILGLLLDILGAVTLTVGLLRRLAGEVKRNPVLFAPEHPGLRWWVGHFPLALAAKFGPGYVKLISHETADDLEDNFWGLVLLVLGFVCQGAGQLITVM